MRTVRAILSFYSSFAFLGFLLTAICLSTVFTTGIAMFTLLFWFKIGTMWLIYNFTDSYKRKEYYYYDNLGISDLISQNSQPIFPSLRNITP